MRPFSLDLGSISLPGWTHSVTKRLIGLWLYKDNIPEWIIEYFSALVTLVIISAHYCTSEQLFVWSDDCIFISSMDLQLYKLKCALVRPKGQKLLEFYRGCVDVRMTNEQMLTKLEHVEGYVHQ